MCQKYQDRRSLDHVADSCELIWSIDSDHVENLLFGSDIGPWYALVSISYCNIHERGTRYLEIEQ